MGDRNGAPFIVGLGGTVNSQSTSDRLLKYSLACCESRGAQTRMFGGESLHLPIYSPVDRSGNDQAKELIEALRAASAVIVCSPGYHGTVSGLIKNALDYVQEMAGDAVPYLQDRAVGLIAVAAGWQATGTTLATLRSITHALRGWPTPLGIAVNSSTPVFDPEGRLADASLDDQLNILADQLVSFSRMQATRRADMAVLKT